MKMPFDYTMRVTSEGHEPNEFGYQFIIRKLEIENEIISGRPLKEGGAPQALAVKGILEKGWPGVSVAVLYLGCRIF